MELFKINQNLPFLYVLLTNANVTPLTSFNQKLTTESCILPFMSDHPWHFFTHSTQKFLTSAVGYSLAFGEFNYQWRSVKLISAYNR